MKAITCSQCGALIKGISSKSEFADCNYCGAEIPIKLDKIIEIADNVKPATPVTQKRFSPTEKENLLRSFEDDSVPFVDEETETGLKMFAFVAALGLLVVIPMILVGFFSAKSSIDDSVRTPAKSSPMIFETPRVELEKGTPTPTPFPDFSYRAYVKHFTDIGAEDVVVPVIEESDLPTMDLSVLKKTVFKQKRIKVRITINPDGEVIEAKPLNGHPALQAICVNAAKKSLFATRKRDYTTDLTYIFVIEG